MFKALHTLHVNGHLSMHIVQGKHSIAGLLPPPGCSTAPSRVALQRSRTDARIAGLARSSLMLAQEA